MADSFHCSIDTLVIPETAVDDAEMSRTQCPIRSAVVDEHFGVLQQIGRYLRGSSQGLSLIHI